jgi:hypothetical protein
VPWDELRAAARARQVRAAGDHLRAGFAVLGNLSVHVDREVVRISLYPALCADVCGCLLLFAIFASVFPTPVIAKAFSATIFASVFPMPVIANAFSTTFFAVIFVYTMGTNTRSLAVFASSFLFAVRAEGSSSTFFAKVFLSAM